MQGDVLESDFEQFRQMVSDGFRAFIVFGANFHALPQAVRELEREAAAPLLIMSDLEQGVGQQVAGGTHIPCAMALAHGIDREDPEDQILFRRLFRLVARESRLAGVNTILSPVADLHLHGHNPIVCTRAYGSDPEETAWFAGEHVRGLQDQGPDHSVLACAKHFPGHGRSDTDSHLHLPVIHESLATLRRSDLLPFQTAIDAGCSMVMMGHLLLPALDPEMPASRSVRIVSDLLRREMGFSGVVVTDAMNMAGALGDTDASTSCREAFEAGCDLILHPADPYAAVEALASARSVPGQRVGESEQRIRNALRRLAQPQASAEESARRLLGDEIRGIVNLLVAKSLRVVKGGDAVSGPVSLLVLDEDETAGNGEEMRKLFLDSFRGFVFHHPGEHDGFSAESFRNRTVVIALFSKISGWKGRSGLSAWREDWVQKTLNSAGRAIVISFGCPSLLHNAAEADSLISAWWGSPVAERAVAGLLCGKP